MAISISEEQSINSVRDSILHLCESLLLATNPTESELADIAVCLSFVREMNYQGDQEEEIEIAYFDKGNCDKVSAEVSY